jgi:N-acetylmuramic acid 6-phosphate (MurNAc-6-P) etherase
LVKRQRAILIGPCETFDRMERGVQGLAAGGPGAAAVDVEGAEQAVADEFQNLAVVFQDRCGDDIEIIVQMADHLFGR